MSQYDLMFDLEINVGQCDLYFMVQWFCLISWRLFDIWTPYFGIMSQYDPMFNLEINVGHCDLYFIVHWFCLISLYLMDECHTFGKWVSVIRSSDLSHPCSLISAFVVRCLDSIIPLLAIAKNFKTLASLCSWGLSRTRSKPPKTGFLVTWLIWTCFVFSVSVFCIYSSP